MEQLILALLKITRLDAGAVIFEKKDHPVVDVVKRGIEELAVRKTAGRERDSFVRPGQSKCELRFAMDGRSIGKSGKNALDYTREGQKSRSRGKSLRAQ